VEKVSFEPGMEFIEMSILTDVSVMKLPDLTRGHQQDHILTDTFSAVRAVHGLLLLGRVSTEPVS